MSDQPGAGNDHTKEATMENMTEHEQAIADARNDLATWRAADKAEDPGGWAIREALVALADRLDL